MIESKRNKEKRAFALPIVFLVLLLVGIALIGLGDTMVVSAQSAQSRAHAQKMFYACEGVARLAAGLTQQLTLDDPSLDTVDLNVALEPIRLIAAEHGIDLSAPTRTPEETMIVEDGALQGLEVISNKMAFGLVTPSGGGGCNINISQPLGKISPLQFFAFSTEGGTIEPSTTGSAADPDFTWGRSTIIAPRQINDQLTVTSELDAPLRMPAPAIGEALGGVRTRNFKPYIEAPFAGNPDRIAERASSRFAYQADLRIVDGEWYLRDPADPTAWPGIPIWGDHPCTDNNNPEKTCAAAFNGSSDPLFSSTTSPLRRMYSVYERTRKGILEDPFMRGVVSYGRRTGVDVGLRSAGPHCNTTTPGALVPLSACVDKAPSAVMAAREAFLDPASGTAILPINIDVGFLGAAFTTFTNEELATNLCISGGTCTRPFNGMIYITSTKGVAPTMSPGPLPYALCGGNDASVDNGEDPGQGIQPCDTAVKYNAVRLHNAANLAVFAPSGLTIASDLPVYVSGGWSNSTPNVRSLIMADRVTVLTSGWRDDGTSTGGGSFDFGGSALTGWPSSVGARKFNDLLRAIESSVNIRVTGSLVGGFTSSIGAGSTGTRITQWTHPFFLTSPTTDSQPPGAPRVAIGLPPEVVTMGGCGGG